MIFLTGISIARRLSLCQNANMRVLLQIWAVDWFTLFIWYHRSRNLKQHIWRKPIMLSQTPSCCYCGCAKVGVFCIFRQADWSNSWILEEVNPLFHFQQSNVIENVISIFRMLDDPDNVHINVIRLINSIMIMFSQWCAPITGISSVMNAVKSWQDPSLADQGSTTPVFVVGPR